MGFWLATVFKTTTDFYGKRGAARPWVRPKKLSPASLHSSTASGLKFKWTSWWGDGFKFKIGNPAWFYHKSHDARHIASNLSFWKLAQWIQALLTNPQPLLHVDTGHESYTQTIQKERTTHDASSVPLFLGIALTTFWTSGINSLFLE